MNRADGIKDRLAETLDRAWSQLLERSVDEGARRVIARLKVPRREELQSFQQRLEKVAQRIEALASQRR